jgi:hypothetical protein
MLNLLNQASARWQDQPTRLVQVTLLLDVERGNNDMKMTALLTFSLDVAL